VGLYTLADRDLLFWATEQQIKALISQLRRGGAPGLTNQLLAELVYAGLNAPGFSESQRAILVAAAEWAGACIRISPLAVFWPFEVLGRKGGVEEDIVEVSIFSIWPPLQVRAGHCTLPLIRSHNVPLIRDGMKTYTTRCC